MTRFLWLALLIFPLRALAMDSLLSIYRDALFADATWQAARAEAAAGREAMPQARARLLPNLSFSASKSKNTTTQESRSLFGGKTTTDYDYDSSNYALTLRQPIYRPQEFAAYEQSQAQVAATEADLAQAGQELALRVGEAYFEALAAIAELEVNAAQQAAYEAQQRYAESAFAAGHGTRTEIDEATSRLDLVRAQALEWEFRRDYALDALKALVDRPVIEIARIDPQRLKLADLRPAKLPEWLERIENRSPQLATLRAQVAAAEAEVRKAQAGHKPTLDLIAQKSKSESENNTSIGSQYDTRLVGLQLNIPIFAGGYVNSTTRQALATLDRQNRLLEAGRREIRLQARQAFDGVRQGVKWVHAYADAARSAAQTLHSTKKGFEAGTRNRLDILNAEQNLATARRDLIHGRHHYLLSHLRLLALAGQLDEAAMAEFDAWLEKQARGEGKQTATR